MKYYFIFKVLICVCGKVKLTNFLNDPQHGSHFEILIDFYLAF